MINFDEIRAKAESGDAGCQYVMWECCKYGYGGNKADVNEALQWLCKAAEAGHSAAQYYLGLAYESGDGIIQDKEEAIKWLRKAAIHDSGQCVVSAKSKLLNDYGLTLLEWYGHDKEVQYEFDRKKYNYGE